MDLKMSRMLSSWNKSTLKGDLVRVGTRSGGVCPNIVVNAGTLIKYCISNIDSFVEY